MKGLVYEEFSFSRYAAPDPFDCGILVKSIWDLLVLNCMKLVVHNGFGTSNMCSG
jgi:hypothetical protein